MKMKLSIKLKNCHGIRELDHTFDLSERTSAAIYAPNGTMKTSFARTLKEYSVDSESSDLMFPERQSERIIVDETSAPIPREDVVVIESYDEGFGPTQSTSTLLVNSDLRREYESIQRELKEAGDDLVSKLKSTAQTKQDIPLLIAKTFTSDSNAFFQALVRVSDELETQVEAPFADIPYDLVFNDKIRALLEKPGFKDALHSYVTRLTELLDESKYFSRDSFSYYNANQITKSLDSNGFFSAKHGLVLRNSSGEELTVNDISEFKTLVDEEKKRIADDESLRKKLERIGTELEKNEETRKFYTFLSNRPEVLPELENPKLFEEKIWKSQLKLHYETYRKVVEQFRTTEQRRREIEAEAAQQRTQWENVISIFNDRFYVPFRLVVKNREKVILGVESALELGFEFNEGTESARVDKSQLMKVLSQGEKKAFYILNVLFEVETRKSNNRETLFIIDDLADSFDYRNKYAIIQYLKDMCEHPSFRMIILTHNFDFFRTVVSRNVVNRQSCFMAQKTDTAVVLVVADYVNNPFKVFKNDLDSSLSKRIAVIPFVRNLIEYSSGENNPHFVKLTSLLHQKADSDAITHADLDVIFNSHFGSAIAWGSPEDKVVDTLLSEADSLIDSSVAANLENKLVLSIAVRILAERFMINMIDDDEFVKGLSGNQTGKLFGKFKKLPNLDSFDLKTMDSVVLMTPENIHLNAFMYEPMVDLSDMHLRKLYRDVKKVSNRSLPKE
jgi:hypothetical protein